MQGYAFTSEANIANTIRPIMAKHGLALVPSKIEVGGSDIIETKNARLNRVFVSATYALCHKSGERIEITVPSEGIDSLDKAIPKALTMAYKYALIQIFCVGRGDDGDAGQGYDRQEIQSRSESASPRPAPPKPHVARDGEYFDYIFTFGKNQGKSVQIVDTSYIEWLIKGYVKDIEDKSKAEYKEKNASMLAIMVAEIKRRKENAAEAKEEIPF